MFLRRIALLLGLLAVATACGDASGQGVDPPETAAVGGKSGKYWWSFPRRS